MNQPIDDYMIRFLSRRESEEDIQKLKKWLADDHTNRDQLKEWLKVWDATDMVNNFEKYDTQKAYTKFLTYLEELENEPKQSRSNPKHMLATTLHSIGKIAAIFIISFALGAGSLYYYLNHRAKDHIAYIENIVPLGSQSEIILPDGSTVWLNAGSKLRYPTDYGKTRRDIFLEGEGYFKVAKNENKTFTVHTSSMSVRALGTEFNVKAYPEEDVVETTLISGEVAVQNETTHTTTKKQVLLKPGQKYSIHADHEKKSAHMPLLLTPNLGKITEPQIKQLSTDIVHAEVSWKEKNWRIEKESLQHLAPKLERRYNVQIKIDEKLMSYHFTGTLKDESLEQVLRAMQSSAPILYTVDGKIVTINADLKRMK